MRSNRLPELMRTSGVTRDQVAQALNVHSSTVWRWETGRVDIPDDAKLKLALLFGVSRAYLMGWDVDPRGGVAA